MTASILPTSTATRQVGIRQRSLRRHCRMGRATELVFILATGAMVMLGGQAEAQDRTWDAGGATTNWLTLNNWAGGGAGRVPDTVGETALITGGGGALQPVIGAGDSVTVGGTNISGGSLTVAGTLTSPVTVSGTGVLSISSGGAVVGAVTAGGAGGSNAGTITGNLTATAGGFTNQGVVTGTTTLNGPTSLFLATGTNLSDTQQVTVNQGTLDVNASDTIGSLAGTGGQVDIAAGQTLTAGGDNTSTQYDGGIIGDGTFTKAGTGTLTLTGATSVASTSISAGTLAVTGAGTIVGNISGAAAGTLSTDGGALSSSTNIAGDITLEITGDETVGNLFGFFGDIEVDNSADLTLTSGTYDVGGTITGDGGITVDGATVQFNGADKAYTGETNVVSGGLTLTSGIASTDVNVSGGSLTATNGALAAGTTLDISGTGSVNIDDDDTVASVTQSGGTLGGDSTLTVTGALGQSGGEIASGVTVNVAGAKTLEGGTIAGTLGGAGLTTVQTGTTLLTGTINGGAVTVTSTLNVDGGSLGANLTLSGGELTAVGTSTLSPTNISLASGTSNTIGAVNGETLTLGPGALNFGANTLTTFGSATNDGTVVLDATFATVSSNSDVTVAGGTLQLGGLNVLTSAGGLLTDRNTTVEAGATLDLAGNLHAIANLAGGGTITNSGGAATVLTLESNLDTEISGVIEDGVGGMSLTKTLGGTTTLSGANTYTGATTVSAGTLALEGGAAIADTSAVQIDAGATLTSTTDNETVGTLSADAGGTLDIGGTLFTTASGTDSEFAGTLLGGDTSGLFKDGSGVLTFSGDGSGFTGTMGASAGEIVLASGATLAANAVGAIAGATFTTEGGALTGADVGVIAEGTINFNGDETVAFLTNNAFNGPGTGTININGAGTVLTLAGGTLASAHSGEINGTGALATIGGTHTLSGDIAIGGGVDVGTGSTLVLGGNNSFGADITVSGTLRLESDGAAGGAAGQIVTQGSVIDYADGVNSATPIEIASNTTQVQVTTGSAEQSGVISEDAAGRPLEKIGAGELVLSAANTFTGDMTVSGGTLSLSGGSALADSVDLILADGTTVNVQTSEVVGSVASATGGTVALGANTLTLSGAVSTSFAGNVTGGNFSAFLTNSGNTITMTGDSTMTGTMGTTGGTMIMAAGATTAAIAVGGTGATGVFTTNGGALAGNAQLVNLSTATININGSETIGSISQSSGGTINVAGGATLTVNGTTNAFNATGASSIGNDILGAGTLNVTGGTTTVQAGGNVATATTIGAGGTVVNNGAMAGVSNAGSITNNGVAGALTNTGAGTGSNTGTLASLTHSSTALFNNAGAITGNVTVNSGTVTLSGASNIGDASTVTVTGGILNAGVADTIGGLVANGGTTNVSAVLTMGELSGTAGSIAMTGTGGLIVGDSDLVNSSFGGVISGTGALEKVGTDTLTLTGANSFSGTTTVSGGTLALTGSGSLDSASLVISAAGSVTSDGGAFDSAMVVTNNGLPAALAAPFGLMLTGGGDETIAEMDGNGTTDLSSGSVLSLTSGTSDIAGVISGDGGLTVTGSSITNLTAVNTYTGETVVNSGGALNLNGVGAIASAVVTISGNGALTTDGDGIADTAAVSVAGANGILRVNGTETIGSLTQNGGFVNGTSTLTTTSFAQTGGTTSGTVTVSTGTFSQNGGTIGTGTTVTQSGGATMSGGSVAGVLTGAGTVTVQTGTTTVTGTIASTNVTVASGELSLDGGEGLTTATDLTVNGGLVDVNIDEAIATLNGSGGTVDVDAANTLTLGEATLDTATYAGNVTGAGDLIKLGTNTQVFSGVNGLTGTVDVNAGTLRITGTIAATDLETAAAGTLETDGSALVSGAVVTNAGTFRITAGTETINAVNGAGTVDLATGNLTLAGANSAISGAITGSGTLTVNAAADGDATGGATLVLSGDSNTFTGTTQVTDGTLQVTATGNLGGAVNVATLGLVQLQGGTLGGTLTNTGGEVQARGTISGNVVNNNVGVGGGADEGIFATTGDLTFTPGATRTFTNAGTVTVTAGSILGLGSYTNQSGGLTTVSGGRTLQATTVTNDAGAVMALDGGTVDGSLTNNGTLQSNGTSTITGNLSNGGTVDLQDGATDDVLTVNGGVSGTGSYQLDLNLSDGTSDRVAGTLATASTINLDFTITGNGYIGSAITVFSGAAGGAAVTGSSALPVGGSIIYTLDQVGSDIQVRSQVNPAVGGVAASASMTQALIGTIVNRPTSPFVSGLAAEEGCSQGGYFRATGGRATVAGQSSSNGFTTNNSISSDFYGVQGGYDVGCFDGRFFDGWDGAAGVMLGYNAGSTDQSLFSDPTQPGLTTGLLGTDFTQNYIGLYVAGAKDRLSADLQLRYDDASFDLSETTLVGLPVGLDGLSYSTKATTIGTRVSYRMDVNEEKGINFVPTAGFNLTHVSGDTLTLSGGETLELEAFTSVVGFVGGALARTFIAEDGGSATTAFVSGNYYQDFGGDRGALFDTDGDGLNPEPVSVASIGGFGEFSLGLNYVKILDAGTAAGAKQLNASIRGDLRIGENVSDAYSVTAQVRLSF